MRGIGGLLAYSVSCYLLNNVLQHHLFHSCRANLLSIFLASGSNYCKFVEAALLALQWSPLIVAGPLLINTQLGADYHAWCSEQAQVQETQRIPVTRNRGRTPL